MPTLILLRHGQSEWNEQNLFTGWYDCDLTATGIKEAIQAGEMLLQSDLIPDVIHSSLQKRAIKTAELVNKSINKKIPIYKNWRLNERHYGDLTGLNKSEAKIKFGEQKIQEWRRGYNTPPPPIRPENRFNPKNNETYKDLNEELIPLSECLADVMNRLLPYWFSDIAPELNSGKKVLIAAHGNSLRALCKHLDKIGDEEIVKLNIPTGIPFIYELDNELNPKMKKPVSERAIDKKAALARTEAAENQKH
jgi:2,3-bisphosphoglycerate-dependent phosphoglycerate mutase|tara:strand:- start:809 stop:1558 length:750 start_codon:yes stop_codon:yes gene_type:complete